MKHRIRFHVNGTLAALLVVALGTDSFGIGTNMAAALDLSPVERLGKHLFFDTNLSTPTGQSCSSCHAPAAGFTSPNSSQNARGTVVAGVIPTRSGFRKTPTIAYAAFSPPLHYSADDESYEGGQFWDGRADSLEDQAKQPFLNPLEMNNPNSRAVVLKVRHASYAFMFDDIFGPGALDLHHIDQAYDNIVSAIAAFERSPEVSPFSSKYDAYLAEKVHLTAKEKRGLDLYEGKANCAACHPNRPSPDGAPPMFTDFTYDNLGVPRNPSNPYYKMPKSVNPAGKNFVDLGLGGFLGDPDNYGRMKVPTLRNLDKRPGAGFVKSYMHNGAFKSIEQVVHFYNARDNGGFAPPEYAPTVNHDELGHQGMTAAEESDLVAFLKTLTDGYTH